jgi:hypothetical protein
MRPIDRLQMIASDENKTNSGFDRQREKKRINLEDSNGCGAKSLINRDQVAAMIRETLNG